MRAYLRSVDRNLPPAPTPSRWRRFIARRLPRIVLFSMVVTLVAVVLYPHMVVTVPSGQVGVLWRRFRGGTVLNPRYLKGEGLHIMLPWNELFLYDLRLQSITEDYNVISSDGVNLTVTINIRFRLQHDRVAELHQAIGPDYAKLLGPSIASQVREVIAQYTAEQIYSTARQKIQDEIRARTLESLGERVMEHQAEEGEEDNLSYLTAMKDTIILYDTLLYGIKLPAVVAAAINRKAEQYYISEEYKFRVEREKRESERKRIEAEGIREFQQIVSQGISESYLRWRGIEATLQLAQSTNSRVVIFSRGKDGLPIILGNADAPPAGATPTSSTERATSPSPLARTPAAGLSTSAEKTPAAASDEQRVIWPTLSLSDVEASLARVTRGKEPKTERLSRQPSEGPAAEQPR